MLRPRAVLIDTLVAAGMLAALAVSASANVASPIATIPAPVQSLPGSLAPTESVTSASAGVVRVDSVDTHESLTNEVPVFSPTSQSAEAAPAGHAKQGERDDYPAPSRTNKVPPQAGSASASTTPDPTELDLARETLADFQNTYRYLDKVTVDFGEMPEPGYEAVAYYEIGRIVISPDHIHPIRMILLHEIWHIIDQRDNGQLDWGDAIPPENAGDYVK